METFEMQYGPDLIRLLSQIEIQGPFCSISPHEYPTLCSFVPQTTSAISKIDFMSADNMMVQVV